MARSKPSRAKPQTPPRPAKKPPKPNPKPAQGPDGPTKNSVAKEGAEYGGGDKQHGDGTGSVSRILGRAIDKLAEALRPAPPNGKGDGKRAAGGDGKRAAGGNGKA